MRNAPRVWVIALIAMIIIAVLALRPADRAGHHFRELEKIKATFNNYQPSILERVRGIRDGADKEAYHLGRLLALGAIRHERFVFTEVPYTRESFRHLWQSTRSNFPNAVRLAATYYDTNHPAYGVAPCTLEVWDVPGEMKRWGAFVRQRNVKTPGPSAGMSPGADAGR